MRSFTEEQFRDAVEAIRGSDRIGQIKVMMSVTDILEAKFQKTMTNMDESPRNAIGALILYGMNIAFAIDDASCAPGDYHCLEHHEKNCECTCEGASQVGKSSEVLNPAGPRYF